MKRFILTTVLFCMMTPLVCKDVKPRVATRQITYQYVVPKNMTRDQAEVTAISKAKEQLLADEFGTNINASTWMTIRNQSAGSEVTSFEGSHMNVNGVWLKTIGDPIVVHKIVNDEYVVEVTIKGKMQAKTVSSIPFEINILRNGVEDKHESAVFKNEDRLYVSFCSPEDGYLSVFYTGDFESITCLYPSAYDTSGLVIEDVMKMYRNKKYVLFSKENSQQIDPVRVEEIVVEGAQGTEPGCVYVVFSPSKYSLPLMQDGTLYFQGFENWIGRLMAEDPQVNLREISITVTE